MTKEAPDWIAAGEAYAALNADRHDPIWTRQVLALHLREGSIAARAEKWWPSSKITMEGALREELSNPDEQKSGDIGKLLWRSWKRGRDDLWEWDWAKGDFIITTNVRLRHSTIMRGVQFRLADLKREHPRIFRNWPDLPNSQPDDENARPSKWEPSTNEERRHNAWTTVVELILAGRISGDAWASESALSAHIESLLKKKKAERQGKEDFKTLSATMIRPIAKAVIPLIRRYYTTQLSGNLS